MWIHRHYRSNNDWHGPDGNFWIQGCLYLSNSGGGDWLYYYGEFCCLYNDSDYISPSLPFFD